MIKQSRILDDIVGFAKNKKESLDILNIYFLLVCKCLNINIDSLDKTSFMF